MLNMSGEHVFLAGWTISGLKRSCLAASFICKLRSFFSQLAASPPTTPRYTFVMAAKAMAAVACQVGRLDLAILSLIGFSFFLRTISF